MSISRMSRGGDQLVDLGQCRHSAAKEIQAEEEGATAKLRLFSPNGVLLLSQGASMKKLSLAMAAVLALLSIAGCAQYVGKGKAPPPVVTKG
jgi:hypothetical protein